MKVYFHYLMNNIKIYVKTLSFGLPLFGRGEVFTNGS
jgi:hypothetical protein